MIGRFLSFYNKKGDGFCIKKTNLSTFRFIHDRSFYKYILNQYSSLLYTNGRMYPKGIKYKSFYRKRYS